ncbi:MAG TPA: LysR substrate-binding domain-containing protein [Vicinamibacterales bacterium]
MPSGLPSLNALRCFEAAARHLSFKKAAGELSVTPTAVSHQIRDLEGYFGQELFRRFARRLELTAAGQVLYPKVKEGMASFGEAVESLRAFRPKAGLTVTAPPTFASRWLVPRLASFTDRHEDIVLHLNSSAETIDDSRRDAVEFGVAYPAKGDAVEMEIRFGIARSSPGYLLEPFLPTEYVLICPPAMLVGESALRRPEDVRHCTLIHDDTIPDERLRPSWDSWCARAGIKLDLEASGVHFHDSAMVLAAVADGMGVALAARQQLGPDLAAGRIAVPFDISVPSVYCYYLVTPEVIVDRPEVLAFREWIKQEAEAVARGSEDARADRGPSPAAGGAS